ncbi:YybH family protein [Tahibacter caeni]|uniref:YybH family protein n=1 Tax=Tahibacter caeni TaxID=1453545 RepID=UPI002147F185|nr:DUF4440 domain-containing protein [Tahibacter caeni]
MTLRLALCLLLTAATASNAFAAPPASAPPASAPAASASDVPAAAAPAPLPSITLPPAIARVLQDYERAWIARDDAALAQLFVADGFALPNGQPPATGADAIRAAYAGNSGSPLALRALHYAESGDMAYVIGGFGGKAGQPDFGKFVLVLRRGGDGVWRIAADMDNANAMPRRAPSQW